jgi:hypothetical protein
VLYPHNPVLNSTGEIEVEELSSPVMESTLAAPAATVLDLQTHSLEHPEDVELHEMYDHAQRVPVLVLLVFWVITSLLAYSLAGERMPWLTVHIALPMLLTAGWGLGFLIDRVDWKRLGTMKACWPSCCCRCCWPQLPG